MKRIVHAAIAILSVGLLASCGGGGGSNSSVPYLAGTYTGTLIKTSQTCPVPDTFVNGTVLVNQNGRTIIINQGNLTLNGSVTSEDSLEASETSTDSNGCITEITVTLTSITNASAADNVDIKVSCGSTTCEVALDGTVARSVPRRLSETGKNSLEVLQRQNDGERSIEVAGRREIRDYLVTSPVLEFDLFRAV